MKIRYKFSAASLNRKLTAKIQSGSICGTVKNDKVLLFIGELYQAKESFPLIFKGRIVDSADGCILKGHFTFPAIPLVITAVIFLGMVFAIADNYTSSGGTMLWWLLIPAVIISALVYRAVFHRKRFIKLFESIL